MFKTLQAIENKANCVQLIIIFNLFHTRQVNKTQKIKQNPRKSYRSFVFMYFGN